MQVSDLQVLDETAPFTDLLVPGDKLLIVGYPYGYSAFGKEQPTPVVLTRFVAAMRVAGWRQEVLLDGAGARGMSGGPVFVERESNLHLIGLYTGNVYPDPQGSHSTLLGRCCVLNLCWRSPNLALVFSKATAP